VANTDKRMRVMVNGQPKTEEVIPVAVLKESINKVAYGYTEKWLGPKEKIGNKGGSLSNRLRAVLNASNPPPQARSNADRAFLR